ncbi:hypothetical protein CYMTET_45613, partial [Cymbomonas tetramitiformis]
MPTAMSSSVSHAIVLATRCHDRSSRHSARTTVNKSGSKSITRASFFPQHVSKRAQDRSDTEKPSDVFKSGLAGMVALACVSVQPLALSPALATDLTADELVQFMPDFTRCINDQCQMDMPGPL